MKEFGRKLLSGLKSMGLFLADKIWANKWPLGIGILATWYIRGGFKWGF